PSGSRGWPQLRTSGVHPLTGCRSPGLQMKSLGGVGETRWIFPFLTWARSQQWPGMFWAGFDAAIRPPALKLVILLSAATRLARVGFWPAFLSAWTNRAAAAHDVAPHSAIESVESIWFMYLSKVDTTGTAVESSPRKRAVPRTRYIPSAAGPASETSRLP